MLLIAIPNSLPSQHLALFTSRKRRRVVLTTSPSYRSVYMCLRWLDTTGTTSRRAVLKMPCSQVTKRRRNPTTSREAEAHTDQDTVLHELTLQIERLQEELARAQAEPARQRMQDTRSSLTHEFKIGKENTGYVIVGVHEDGQAGEVFIKMAKEGSTISGLNVCHEQYEPGESDGFLFSAFRPFAKGRQNVLLWAVEYDHDVEEKRFPER